jgi:hypothetical protein
VTGSQARTGVRLLGAATALIAIAAIVAQVRVLSDAGALDLVNFLSYFTIQSNILGIVAMLGAASYRDRLRPAWLEWLRGASTVYLTITFVVVIVLLSNVDVGLQLAWVDFVLHKLTPVVMVAAWLLDPPATRTTTREALSWLVFPLIWLAYTLVRGPIAAWYPYPFLDPANGGYGQVAIVSALVLIAGTGVCLAVAWAANRPKAGTGDEPSEQLAST